MPSLEDHCQECQEKLGNRYEELNIWIDEHWSEFGPDHRDIRHHNKCIEKIRDEQGDDAAKAIELHIVADCRGIPNIDQCLLRTALSGGRAYDLLCREFNHY